MTNTKMFCDICGKEVKDLLFRSDKKRRIITQIVHWGTQYCYRDTHDVCEECHKAYEKWFQERKQATRPTE